MVDVLELLQHQFITAERAEELKNVTASRCWLYAITFIG